MQYDWCLYKKGTFGPRDRDTQREYHVKVKAKIVVMLL